MRMLKSIPKKILTKKLPLYIGRVLPKFGYDENKDPTFIIGTGRCGSSLLVDILNTNKELINFFDEANDLWHPNLYPYNSSNISSPPIEVAPKKFTQKSLESWPPNHEYTIREIFLGWNYLNGRNKKLYVKSAMISFMIPKILDMYPEASFIHIFRNGPSVVNSYVKKNYSKYDNFELPKKEYCVACANYWESCIIEIEEMVKKYDLKKNNQILQFSYESLCNNTGKVLDQIRGYLDLKSDFSYDKSKISSTNDKIEGEVDFIELIKPYIKKGMTVKDYW